MAGRLDKLGMFLSIGCLIHCLLLPVILPLIPVMGLAVGHNGYFHLTMCGIIFINICLTLVPGTLKHKKGLSLMLGIYGLLFIIAGDMAELITANNNALLNRHNETIITIIGSCMIVTAHYLNHKYRCACNHHHHEKQSV